MPQREFQITISPEGEVEVEIRGYKGKAACANIAALFEEMIGEVRSFQNTSEAYEPEETVRITQQH